MLVILARGDSDFIFFVLNCRVCGPRVPIIGQYRTVRAEHTPYALLIPVEATPRTSSTFASISGAFIPAASYIFVGEL